MDKNAFILKTDNEIALLIEEKGVLKYKEVNLSEKFQQKKEEKSDNSSSFESDLENSVETDEFEEDDNTQFFKIKVLDMSDEDKYKF